jgi:protein-L-isoaspartate(D-aspartate) O-methyltransferase
MAFLSRSSGDKLSFSEQRKQMVATQLERREITDRRVLKVMSAIPREEFIPQKLRSCVYDDGPLPIGEGQTISQPLMVALMTQLLELRGGEKVLEIGTGSGYQAAILAKLAKRVYTVERHRQLLQTARKAFQKLRLKNIQTKFGDGSSGWSEHAPFDAIIVTAAADRISEKLTDQLADGGRLVIPVGKGAWQRLKKITKIGKELKEEDFGLCAFVPLIKSKP